MWGVCGEIQMERHNRRINSAKRRKLIAAYKLPGASGSGQLAPVDRDDDFNAAVVNNSVISFVEGMSGLNRSTPARVTCWPAAMSAMY